MNEKRRKQLANAVEVLNNVLELLEEVTADEQDAYDNLPESIQDSDRGEAMQENVDDMEDASSSLQDIIDQLQDIIDR